jgi:hypothetical protein
MNEFHHTVHEKVLCYQSMETIVSSGRFERLANVSTPQQLAVVREAIRTGDRKAIIRWMQDHPSKSHGEMSSPELKRKAQRCRIPNYSRLNKIELMEALDDYEERRKAQGNSLIS